MRGALCVEGGGGGSEKEKRKGASEMNGKER
jgi:hypothetical protein